MLVGSHIAWSQTNVMQFAAYPPDAAIEKFIGDHAWRIFATGEIDSDADKRLAALTGDVAELCAEIGRDPWNIREEQCQYAVDLFPRKEE